jgi:hypothetical protein
MTASSSSTCLACGADASGKFCSTCGATLGPRVCGACLAELSPQARFCHRCGQPVKGGKQGSGSDRRAWLIAAAVCVLSVAAIAYKVRSDAPEPAAPNMANPGVAVGAAPQGPAPDISRMTPRERFDRLFNRIMQADERGDSSEVESFTPMALGAYDQLDATDIDARYHAAVLRNKARDFAGARALADTILTESPGHLFGYIIRGESAHFQNDGAALAQAQRDFLSHYGAAMRSNRVEYLEHKPAVEEFKAKAEEAVRR